MTAFELLLKQLGDRISKDKTSYIFTPYKIASDMLELFPDEVWDSESKFLDIQCKSGVFLYLIYNKLMTHERVIKQIPDPVLRNNHILENQLYGIAPDETCKFIATRMVYGYLRCDSNIIHIESFTDKVLKTNKEEFKALINKEFNREMKFTAIVGNPPYNNDQYIPFVTKAKGLDPDYICMITPAKWQAKGGGRTKSFVSRLCLT